MARATGERGRWWAGAAVLVVLALVVLGTTQWGGSGGDGATSGPRSSSTTTGATTGGATTAAAPQGSTTGPSAPSTRPSTTRPSGAGGRLPELARLRVAEPSPNLPEYRRVEFGPGGWDYDPASGCNTRERVLIAESLSTAVLGARCKVLRGTWVSLYDGLRTADPADLQIDHFVPLAEAWRSGAATWTAERRHRFANDLTDPRTLVAVSSHTNESKSDDPPDRWLPPDRSAWCAYAADWIEVKGRWDLSVTPSEGAALARILSTC